MQPLQVVRDAYDEYMQYEKEDKALAEYLLCIVIANMFPGETVWGYVVGPPGSGKTEGVRPYSGSEHIFSIDDLSPSAMASHYKDPEAPDADHALIPKLDQKTLIIKDFTTMLSSSNETIEAVMGQFRSAYDGTFDRATGVGYKGYRSKFGVIICTTGEMDARASRHQKLGERFLCFRIQRGRMWTPLAHRIDRHRKVLDAAISKEEWRAKLRDVVQPILTKLKAVTKVFTKLPPIQRPEEMLTRVLMLGDLLARCRSQPIYGHPTEPEDANRLNQQLAGIATARAFLDGRDTWNEEDYQLLLRIGTDTFPPPILAVLYHLYKSTYTSYEDKRVLKGCQSAELASHVGFSEDRYVAPLLGQYHRLGIVSKKGAYYTLSEEAYGQLEAVGLFQSDEPPPTLANATLYPVAIIDADGQTHDPLVT